MDDEYTSTNSGCCNAMFELNNKSCNVGEFAVGILALNAIDKKLYISDFIWGKVSWIVKVIVGSRDILCELKNSFRLIEFLVSIDKLPWVKLNH